MVGYYVGFKCCRMCCYNVHLGWSRVGSSVHVMTNDQKELLGVHFQDDLMKRAFDAYPEILFIDATYKLLELRFPLYIILIEDGNGQSEIASAFLLLEETETSLSKIMSIFKENNPSWTATRVLMADKDMTERDVLASNFPNADLLICLYHTLRSFRREISCEKMGITSGQRTLYLELLQQMAYATNEVKYAEIVFSFQNQRSCSCNRLLQQAVASHS